MFFRQSAGGAPFHDRVKVTKSQYLLATIALTTLILLGISSIFESRLAGNRTQVLSNIETPAASIIFTQRETLVYATRLALWSNGGTSRRNVQIARALLAQRLAVVDSSGRTMGSRANFGYWKALKASDAIVAAAPTGVLPENLHSSINKTLLPVIDQIITEARNLVVSYQRSIDKEMKMLAQETARRDAYNLILLYLFIFFGGLFLLLNARTNFKNFRLIKREIESERKELEKAEHQVAQLKDLDTAKNALISNVNHELRTPLTSIIGYTELLQRDLSETQTSKQRQYLEVLQRNSQILLTLVESLLSLSKFDSGVGKLPNEPVSLKEVLEGSIFSLKPTLESANIQCELLLERDLFVRGDIGQLSQVFINLITNSIKFSSAGKVIRIELNLISKEDGSKWAQVSIDDEGIGIDKDDIQSIFDRFYRGKNIDTDQYQGTGLGLAIVKQVIDHHNGTIEVRSELGVGSTFVIAIPLFAKVDSNG
jgi:signal transduction histidine kinase